MNDPDRSAHPDSFPPNDNDIRSDIEQAVSARADDVERMGTEADDTSATEATVSADTAGGAGGVVRNQDMTQQ